MLHNALQFVVKLSVNDWEIIFCLLLAKIYISQIKSINRLKRDT